MAISSDRPSYFDLDNMQEVSEEATALTIVGVLRQSSYPISGRFLGLCAGVGCADRIIASRFGINDVTLVDKNPPNIPDFQGTYKRSDLFNFLVKDCGKYGLVTVLGIEYLLEDKNAWNQLWDGLKRVTHGGSVVVVSPWNSNFDSFQPDGFLYQIHYNNYYVAQRT